MSKITELNQFRQQREQKAKETEQEEITELMVNPVIHGMNNLVFVVRGNGKVVELYQKKNADDPFDKWEFKGHHHCDHLLHLALMTAGVLEQKVFMLRDKYEPESIRMDLPPSFGVPTGVTPDGKETGYTEQYENKPKDGK